jgi:hypothetical protein
MDLFITGLLLLNLCAGKPSTEIAPLTIATMKSKITGVIFTLAGVAGLVYAAISQFTNGMAKHPVAGILLLSLLIVFIGVSQLYKKQSNEY